MKKNKLLKSFLLTIIITFMAIILLSDSWAIDRPTTTFTGSDATITKNNLFSSSATTEQKNAFGAFLHNYDVANNYKTNSNIPMYSLMKNLEFATSAEQFEIRSDNPDLITDTGLYYLLANGYNLTNTKRDFFTVNNINMSNSEKQYVTQIAIWQYINKHQDKFNDICIPIDKQGLNACDFYDNSNNQKISNSALEQVYGSVSDNKYISAVTNLINAAEEYKDQPASYGISEIKSYNITDNTLSTAVTITPSTDKANYLYSSVKIVDPNNYGAYILDKNGDHVTTLNEANETFRVFVPLKKDLSQMDLTTVKIQVTATFMKNEILRYKVTNTAPEKNSLAKDYNGNKYSIFADQVLAMIGTKQVNNEKPLKNFVKVSKVDITNMEELPGATLVITDSSNKTVDTWQSTEAPHYVVLDTGKYKLCETIPPSGYQLNTECIQFEVKDNEISSVTMKNTAIPDVPDTAAFKNIIVYIIGIMIFAGGLVAIIYTTKKKKEIN